MPEQDGPEIIIKPTDETAPVVCPEFACVLDSVG
jgi:hypothetical protein